MAAKTILNVYYDDTHQLALDLYPTRGPARAGVIVIHGGGWFRGDKRKESDWANRLNARGFYVIAPNYREGAQGHYPAPLADMDKLWDWIHRRDLPFNRRALAVVGASAGGNLAVEMALKYGIPGVSLSGILDIADWLGQHRDVIAKQGDTSNFGTAASNTINQSGANDAFYKWFITNYLPDPADYVAATPAKHVTSTSGPMYLANSLNEFVPTSGVAELSGALGQAGIPHSTRMLAGSRHGEGYLDDVFADTTGFLEHTLGLK
ncbi:alpha/beta hydrolase [Lacticaseibacillus baoqingensis]|uniref:Alpha/beta hydrolase n=1 Tax=Lacticaseibacillus baoqingensis TaxID=2486013 RepID=A0ABW4E6W6_9LACO|nr:alpha/beta hydrolase [Lacticaseibacillus baoqingensis]